MAVAWTADQQRVIDTRGKNILVSAAAGSGKTAVLAARILALITDEKDPMDIDELLVVTFTRAAADEMRERIRRELETAHRKHPSDRHLLRQLTLIHNASIMTIDSFCMQVVKNHFQEVDLDPSFRVGEEGELKLLMQDVIEEILEEAYEEGTKEFLDFADGYASGRTDRALEGLILKLYQFSSSHPWPDAWLEQCMMEAEEGLLQEDRRPLWLEDLMQSIRSSLDSYLKYAKRAAEICRMPDGPYMYEEAIASDIRQLEEMMEAGSFERLYAAITSYQPVRLSGKRDAAVSEAKKAAVKELRENWKKGIDGLKKKYFFQSIEEMQDSMNRCRTAETCLVKLTRRFARRYQQKKQDRNLVDFSDLEHDALHIFLKETEGGLVRSDVARAYAKKYREIFIDEYQDSNLVQEVLLNSISREEEGGRNLFMVGDVKQSIYSFRLARPQLFLEKYHRYGKGAEGCLRIDLKQNFRSRKTVLEGINFLFRQIMQAQLGEVEYDDAAALYPGAAYSGEDEPGELILLENDPDSEEQERTSRELEAKLCADRIRKLKGELLVTDEETKKLRPVKYSDMVILLRAMDGWADVVQEVLTEEGIPCRAMQRSGYFTSMEIQILLNFLRIIDNPRQDIPLTSVLKSPIGGFSEEELAKIRSAFPQGAFYEACLAFREQESASALKDKLNGFYRMLEHYRSMVPYTPIHQLIWDILDQTGFEAYVSAMPGGAARRANLHMLADKAMVFESTSYSGLFHFVRYIDRMIRYQVDCPEADGTKEQPDAVEIQSIHKSKGLEYPVVFLMGLGKRFNEMDVRSPVVLHMEYGIGLDYVDPKSRVKFAVLKKRAMMRRMRSEMLGEELRVLYVAMTRAKEKLILTGTVRSLEKEVPKWYEKAFSSSEKLSYDALFSAGSCLDFLMPALLRNSCCETLLKRLGLEAPVSDPLYLIPSGIQVKVTAAMDMVWEKTGQELKRQEQLEQWRKVLQRTGKEETPKESPEASMLWEGAYPWKRYENLPVKLSVSELKKQKNKIGDEASKELYEDAPVMPLIPRFLSDQKSTSGSVRGDAYHRLMEMLDFAIVPEREFLEKEILGLIESGRFSREEYELVDPEDILLLLSSSLGRRMAGACRKGLLFREQPFVLGLPAGEVRPEYADSGEQLLIQGIIDAFFYEGEELVLLDYKTDRLYREEDFENRYRIQLDYYKKALEQITEKRVKEIYIYSFTLEKAICLYRE